MSAQQAQALEKGDRITRDGRAGTVEAIGWTGFLVRWDNGDGGWIAFVAAHGIQLLEVSS
jgi:hypothetical protein